MKNPFFTPEKFNRLLTEYITPSALKAFVLLLMQDCDIYWEVRKNGVVDFYYQGGCLISLHYMPRYRKFRATTHYKYLNPKILCNISSPSKVYLDLLELPLTLDRTLLSDIKCRIRTHSKSTYNREQWSEKYIQGIYRTTAPEQYIDSEFQYSADNEGLRIDLVECNTQGEIRFIELKRIDDNRMLHKELDNIPKIVDQMLKYQEFIEKYSDHLLTYYQAVYDFKKQWLHPTSRTIPCRPKSVNTRPHLLIFNRWINTNNRRKTHTDNMLTVLQRANISYTIQSDIMKPKTYKERQTEHQENLLANPGPRNPFQGARANGCWWDNKKRQWQYSAHIIRHEDSLLNLYYAIRFKALRYFEENQITWWNADKERYFPTGNVLSSQIHCLNHLFLYRHNKAAVLTMIQALCPTIVDILPSPIDHAETSNSEEQPSYITFEFVLDNQRLLGEEYNLRGKKCTSVDAFVYAVDNQGNNVLIPIEWKYTETYVINKIPAYLFSLVEERYLPLVNIEGSNLTTWPKSFYHDPWYEFARQTLLMEQVIRHSPVRTPMGKSVEAQGYIHIIVRPDGNEQMVDFIGQFREQLSDPSRLIEVTPEQLLAPLKAAGLSDTSHFSYLSRRYWIVD